MFFKNEALLPTSKDENVDIYMIFRCIPDCWCDGSEWYGKYFEKINDYPILL